LADRGSPLAIASQDGGSKEALLGLFFFNFASSLITCQKALSPDTITSGIKFQHGDGHKHSMCNTSPLAPPKSCPNWLQNAIMTS
jgi:hypothetical protein